MLKVQETDLIWNDQVVYHQVAKTESFAWGLYKDGLRYLTLRPGVEEDEIMSFLEMVVRARLLAADAGDDLLTLLWERDFLFIDYHFAEVITDSLQVLDPQAVEMGMGPDPMQQVETHKKVETEVGRRGPGTVDLDEFDSTLYFLDENEVLTLQRQVDEEYRREVRTDSLNALLDTFELQPQTGIREEVIGILESIFPNLLNRGEFRQVAWLLRELRLIAGRVSIIDSAVKVKLDSFESRLSDPAILAQILQLVDESAALPEDEDVGELLKELKAPALEAILSFLPRAKTAAIGVLLENAAIRIARGNTDELLRILRNKESEGITGAITLTRRLQFQPAVALLGDLLAHPEPGVRLAVVEALGGLGTPGAFGLLERGIDDADRAVRLAAVAIVAARGFKGSLRRLEAAVQGKGPNELERGEKRQFFEAYALVAGVSALPILTDILEPKGLFRRKESPETRTCAAYAVAKIRTPEARATLERAAQDKEIPVRNAAARALREWPE
ncbi:MAG: HEAT repeat domain-containing protein [Gemmatimonadota bacterium]